MKEAQASLFQTYLDDPIEKGAKSTKFLEGALLRLATLKSFSQFGRTEDFFNSISQGDLQSLVYQYVPILQNRITSVFTSLIWLSIRTQNGFSFLYTLLDPEQKSDPGKTINSSVLSLFGRLIEAYSENKLEDFADLEPSDEKSDGYRSLESFYQKYFKRKRLNLHYQHHRRAVHRTDSLDLEPSIKLEPDSLSPSSIPSISITDPLKPFGEEWSNSFLSQMNFGEEEQIIKSYQAIFEGKNTPYQFNALLIILNIKTDLKCKIHNGSLEIAIKKNQHKLVLWILIRIQQFQKFYDPSIDLDSRNLINHSAVQSIIPGLWVWNYTQYVVENPSKKGLFELIIKNMIEVGADITRMHPEDKTVRLDILTALVKNCSFEITTNAIKSLTERAFTYSFPPLYQLCIDIVETGNSEATERLLKGGLSLFYTDQIFNNNQILMLTMAIKKRLSFCVIEEILSQLSQSPLSPMRKMQLLNNPSLLKGTPRSNILRIFFDSTGVRFPISQDMTNIALALLEENKKLASSLQTAGQGASHRNIVVRSLIQQAQVSGTSVLLEAVRGDHPDLLVAILSILKCFHQESRVFGDLFYYDTGSDPSLLILALINKKAENAKILIDYKANIFGVFERDGSTALMIASQFGYIEVMKALFKKLDNMKSDGQVSESEYTEYINVHMKMDKGVTALYFALQNKHWEAARLLLERPVQVHISRRQEPHITLIMLLQEEFQPDLLECVLQRLEKQGNLKSCIEHVFYSPATPDSLETGGNGLLMFLRAQNPKGAAILLKYKADFLYQSSVDGATALIFAARHGYIEIVSAILKNLDELKIQGILTQLQCYNYLNTHLYGEENTRALALLARQFQHHDIVEALLKYGVNAAQDCTPFKLSTNPPRKDVLIFSGSLIFSKETSSKEKQEGGSSIFEKSIKYSRFSKTFY